MQWGRVGRGVLGVSGAAVLLSATAVPALAASNLDGALIEQLTSTGFVAQHTPQPDLPAVSGNQGWVSTDVSAISTNDVWAVGRYTDRVGTLHAATEHWNGSSWQNISNSAAPGGSALTSVAMHSSNDVWAVGYRQLKQQGTAGPPWRTLIEHWNGSAWSVVSSPDPLAGSSTGVAFLTSVTADRVSDAWAAGQVSCGSSWCPVLEHWNGTAWSTASSGLASPQVISDLSADSPTDAWATVTTFSASGQMSSAAVLHWNGSSWAGVSAVPSGYEGVALWAGSTQDIWAIAVNVVSTDEVIVHWNGSVWQKTYDEPQYNSNIEWADISGTSASNVYAVGMLGSDPSVYARAQHWGGTKWSVVAAQNPVTTNASGPNSYVQDTFTAVSAVPGGAFAEGSQGYNSPG